MKSSRTRSSFVIFFLHSFVLLRSLTMPWNWSHVCVCTQLLSNCRSTTPKTACHHNAVPKVSECNVGICCAFFSVDSQRRIHSLDWDSRAGGARGFSEWWKTLGVVSSACGFECVPVCWQTNYSCYFQIIWGHNLGVCPSRSLCVFLPFKWSTLVGFSPIPTILEN